MAKFPKKITQLIDSLKKDNGTYKTTGLSLTDFKKVMRNIRSQQNKARRSAKRTLTNNIFNKPTPKALKKLGKKAGGGQYTVDDLKEFDKKRKGHAVKYDSKTAGITSAFLIKNSREIDIKRANNQVNDGRGINRAELYGVQGNIVLIRVKASSVSKHEEHEVRIRLEQWNDAINSLNHFGFDEAVKNACIGRMSFDCDCGRHQYWYRYLATMGNYQITPPSEFAFPKVRNPEMIGVACKHVLRSVTMLKSIAWQRVLVKQMEAQSKRVGFGSDNRTYTLTASEQKSAAKNRKVKTDKNDAERAHKQYLRAQKAMEKKIAETTNQSALAKRQARVIRKQDNQLGAMRDMIKVGLQNQIDTYKANGKTQKAAMTDFAKTLGISESKLKGLIK